MSHNFLTTYSGKKFFPAKPQEDQICIGDIAHSLAHSNRYNGHTRQPYSIAEHSVRVSRGVPSQYRLFALLHDAGEAYLGDIISPIKCLLQPLVDEVEDRIMRVIAKKFGFLEDYLDETACDYVKTADLTVASTEMTKYLEGGKAIDGYSPWVVGDDWTGPWKSEWAEAEFLKEFFQLWPRTAQTNAHTEVTTVENG